MKNALPIPFPNRRHDHRRCVETALAGAEAACRRAGMRLTKLRREVLVLIWREHAPVKAYDLLHGLHAVHPRAAPPTVYRALEFLQQAGLVHRIESLNAFVGCADPSHPHDGQFLLCRHCGAVAEIHDPAITQLLQEQARRLGFQSEQALVEIKGRCPRC